MRKIFYILFIFSLSTTINLYAQEPKQQNDSVKIKEVTVFGSKQNQPLSVTVVNEKTIENSLETNVLPVLTEQVPGLFITQRGVMGYGVAAGAAGGISIRGIGGAPTTGVLILIDGHPQFMGLMGHPLADSYESSMIEKVEVTRGSASMMYGSNAIGGVINIITKKQTADGTQSNARLMYGSYNTLSADVSAGLKNGKWNSTVDLGYNRSNGNRENMDFKQYSGYGKVGYDFSKNWKSYIDFNISKTFSSNPGIISKPIIDNDADILRGMSSLVLENNFQKTAGEIMLYGNFGVHKINDGYFEGAAPKTYRFNSQDQLFGAILQQNLYLIKGNSITFGLDFTREGGKAWNKFIDENVPDVQLVDIYLNDIAGYVNAQQNWLNDKLKISAGIRYDVNEKTGGNWIPQFAASYQPIKSTLLKVVASKGFRNPTIREMYMFPPQNPNLNPEELMNYEFSVNQNLLQNKLNIGLNIFHIQGRNIIQTVFENGQPLNVNVGKVENSGFEFNSGYKLNKNIYLSANYSFLQMKYKVLGAPEHKLYIGGNYTLEKWNFATGLQYINGLYTAVGDNPEKENFTLWNANISYKIVKQCDVFVKAENILGQEYQIIAGYPMPKTTIFGGLNFHI